MAEKAIFRILFADYRWLNLAQAQRTAALKPTPFLSALGAGFPDSSNISYNPSKHQYL